MFRSDAAGTEFDFFACDRCGRVALFSSGGSGQVPASMASSEEEVDAVMRSLGLEHEFLRDTAAAAAAAGLYHFDVDIHGGPFRRIAKPARPVLLEDLPEALRSLAAQVLVEGEFARLRRVRCELFRS